MNKGSIDLLNPIIEKEEIQLLHKFREFRNNYTHKDLNRFFYKLMEYYIV